MIRHIVFFSAKNQEYIDKIGAGLRILHDNPHVQTLEVERNFATDPIEQDPVDWVVYGELRDANALAAFKQHPTYQRAIEIVRPLRELRLAADFQTML